MNDTIKFQEKLLQAKAELERQLKELNQPVDMGDDIDSFDEEADEAEEMSTNQGTISALKQRYLRIKDALNKIQKGSYGTCEKCGGQIGAEVLNIDPESRFCQACKLAAQ